MQDPMQDPIRVQAPRRLEGRECVDTCGAGDCFAACLLHKLLQVVQQGDGEESQTFQPATSIEAVEYACRGGTWCCQQIGACVRAVTAKDLENV